MCYIYLFVLKFVVSPGPTSINLNYHGMIQVMCGESAVKHQPISQRTSVSVSDCASHKTNYEKYDDEQQNDDSTHHANHPAIVILMSGLCCYSQHNTKNSSTLQHLSNLQTSSNNGKGKAARPAVEAVSV